MPSKSQNQFELEQQAPQTESAQKKFFDAVNESLSKGELAEADIKSHLNYIKKFPPINDLLTARRRQFVFDAVAKLITMQPANFSYGSFVKKFPSIIKPFIESDSQLKAGLMKIYYEGILDVLQKDKSLVPSTKFRALKELYTSDQIPDELRPRTEKALFAAFQDHFSKSPYLQEMNVKELFAGTDKSHDEIYQKILNSTYENNNMLLAMQDLLWPLDRADRHDHYGHDSRALYTQSDCAAEIARLTTSKLSSVKINGETRWLTEKNNADLVEKWKPLLIEAAKSIQDEDISLSGRVFGRHKSRKDTIQALENVENYAQVYALANMLKEKCAKLSGKTEMGMFLTTVEEKMKNFDKPSERDWKRVETLASRSRDDVSIKATQTMGLQAQPVTNNNKQQRQPEGPNQNPERQSPKRK